MTGNVNPARLTEEAGTKTSNAAKAKQAMIFTLISIPSSRGKRYQGKRLIRR
jgi:hypothetical protein